MGQLLKLLYSASILRITGMHTTKAQRLGVRAEEVWGVSWSRCCIVRHYDWYTHHKSVNAGRARRRGMDQLVTLLYSASITSVTTQKTQTLGVLAEGVWVSWPRCCIVCRCDWYKPRKSSTRGTAQLATLLYDP